MRLQARVQKTAQIPRCLKKHRKYRGFERLSIKKHRYVPRSFEIFGSQEI